MDINDFEPLIIAIPKKYKELLLRIADTKGMPINTFILNLFYDYFDRNKLLTAELKQPGRAMLTSLGEVAWHLYEGTLNPQTISQLQTQTAEVKPTTPERFEPSKPVEQPVERKEQPISHERPPEMPKPQPQPEPQPEPQPQPKPQHEPQPRPQPKVEQEKQVAVNEPEPALQENIPPTEPPKRGFIAIADELNMKRGLGKSEEVKYLLRQLKLPADTIPDIVHSARKVEEIAFAYKNDPDAFGFLIDALDNGEISIDDAYAVVMQTKEEKESASEEDIAIATHDEDTVPPEQPAPAVEIIEVPDEEPEEPIEKLFSEEVEQAPAEEVLSSTDNTFRQPENEPLLASNTVRPNDVLEEADSEAKLESEENAEDVEEKVMDSLQSIVENLRLK